MADNKQPKAKDGIEVKKDVSKSTAYMDYPIQKTFVKTFKLVMDDDAMMFEAKMDSVVSKQENENNRILSEVIPMDSKYNYCVLLIFKGGN
jgi:hypothetical protein